MTNQIPFMKMHGLGNDFVIVDSRNGGPQISPEIIQGLGNRHLGIGFDQLAIIHDSPNSDVALTFYNVDGSTAGACGNATRCIAQYEMDRLNINSLSLTTERGVLAAIRSTGLVSVNMGHPQLKWDEIPLARSMNTLHLPLDGNPTATGIGNPHCTFFVEDAEAVDVGHLGPILENNSLFPERTNVQFAHVIGKNHPEDAGMGARRWRDHGLRLILMRRSSCGSAFGADRARSCNSVGRRSNQYKLAR